MFFIESNQASSLSLPEVGLSEIRWLLRELASLPKVQKVVASPRVSNDLHRVTFYLNVPDIVSPDGDFDETGELWETAERLTFKSNMKLRESTGEGWYFHTQLVKDFSNVLGNR